MKNMIFSLGLLFVISAKADIEYVPAEQSKATPQEIQVSRSCFQELDRQGCGNPSDDHQHFRSCLNNVFPTLSKSCQKMMSELYGSK